ncbi:MAG TPA: NAD(P)-binding domain-containing protein [Gemmatimonadaceae bacterium]|nr:NAD(P)-binding domain-containing protein [Gemmatimonadaceae bacterium]
MIEPAEAQRLVPALRETRNPQVWVYRYTQPETGWVLSIATHGAPGSGRLSLGGFRIAPAARAERPDYDNDAEAIGLAMGMEEKVHWSRVIRAGGPLGRDHVAQLVGGKCVLLPTPDARVGQTRDFALLDWALACFGRFEGDSGVRLNTGQDLGHGIMSDGSTPSLDYLGERFHGCVFSDTSKPTGEGNYYVLKGMLRALGLPLAGARVGLIGCGNIGEWVLRRVLEDGAVVVALEAREAKREALRRELGVDVRPAEAKPQFLAEPLDAIVVNANGGTLDLATCEAIARNGRVRVVCGSENLTMPDPRGAEVLRRAGTVYAPTEYGGMMGYLTAIEEYFARHEGLPFDLGTMLDAAERLEEPSCDATARVRASGFEESFEDAVEAVGAAER